jgi:hypothetical protein
MLSSALLPMALIVAGAAAVVVKVDPITTSLAAAQIIVRQHLRQQRLDVAAGAYGKLKMELCCCCVAVFDFRICVCFVDDHAK